MAVTMVAALNRGLTELLDGDHRVVVLGEDVGRAGGVFHVTDGLADAFGRERCFDTPIAEAGIVGFALGMTLAGFRPIVEMQFDAFSYPAFEQITSHAAKWRFRSRGRLDVPLVIRIPVAGRIGAVEHHSECVEPYFLPTAGLLMAAPATPRDAYALLLAAAAQEDPVVFLEPKRLYWATADEALEADPVTERFQARVRRAGTDVSLVTFGSMVGDCLEVAAAAAEAGIDVEVVDLRWLNPLDDETVLASVSKTGRCVVVQEAPVTGGIAAEVVSRVCDEAFYSLLAPPRRVGAYDLPYPPALVERQLLPTVDGILAAVDESMTYT